MASELPDDWYVDHDGQRLVLDPVKVRVEIERLRALLRDAPVLVVDRLAASMRGEREVAEYAKLLALWAPKARAAIGCNNEQSKDTP